MVAFSANVTSLLAHQQALNVNAHNVANVNTEGFVPSRTTFSDSSNGSVQANFQQLDDNGSINSQTDLAVELTNQTIIEKGHAVQASAIKTQDAVLGTLLDIIG